MNNRWELIECIRDMMKENGDRWEELEKVDLKAWMEEGESRFVKIGDKKRKLDNTRNFGDMKKRYTRGRIHRDRVEICEINWNKL